MTDKSFGDYPNRNIVKNPLLSSAVTGLSLEDLTHNAVLLPVSLTQEVITRSEEQNKPQPTSLENTEHAVSTQHAGDANANRLLQSTSQPIPTNPFAININQIPDQVTLKPHLTHSKASHKSENDDFDVNEYFARLHGTRYVSAPLNSNLKEDSNANLDATEENLEEINLNEPDRPDVNAQQSLTADIAQNFSQLPTVLPQMASAVFSSFSNMLQTRKSREQTPEVTSGYLDVQFERPEPSPIMAPPKEPPALPPSVGTANYRLPSKKKYAQIPGLSSGETASVPFQSLSQNMPPANQNPPFFIPSADNNQNQSQKCSIDVQNNNVVNSNVVPTYFVPTFDDKQQNTDVSNIIGNRNNKTDTHSVAQENLPHNTRSGEEANVPMSVNQSNPQPQFYSQDIIQATAKLPPPPTFANMPRRDSQSGIGKSFLPPSVARRISSNQQKQSIQIPEIPSNIFIPAVIQDSMLQETSPYLPFYAQASSVSKSPVPSSVPPSASLAQISKPVSQPSIDKLPQSTVSQFSLVSDYSSLLPPKTEGPAGDYVKPTIPLSLPTTDQVAEPLQAFLGNVDSSNVQESSQIPISPLMPYESQPTSTATVVPPPMYPTNNTQTLPPIMFMPTSTPMPVSNIHTTSVSITTPILSNPSLSVMLPTYFTPSTSAESKEFPPIANQTTPNPMPQPPKSSGNINFRMIKKRPQYYSGPIGGVGDISNNVKPVMPPINTGAMNLPPMSGAFQGSLFIPAEDNNQTQTRQPEIAPFDISKPAEPMCPTVSDTPQTEIHSTAFDMSRPTTESYSEPKQEPTGFGLLGSLKSKLTSLDINKIQNSVTTFFDPAYKDTKKEDQSEKPQDNYHYVQPQQYSQPQQYGQTQNNFEIFVPNVEQTNLNFNQSYLYQMQFQNQFHYNQQQQAYLSNEPHNYYQNQGYHGQHHQNKDQNISSYFGNTSENYQTPIGPTTTYPAATPETSLPTSVQQTTVVPKTSLQEIQQTYFSNPNYQSQDSLQAQISSESGSEIKEPYPSDIPSPIVSSMSFHDNQGFDGNTADISPRNVSDSINDNQFPQKDASNLSNQNDSLGIDSSKNVFVNTESETKSENITDLTPSSAQILLEAFENVNNKANEASQDYVKIHQRDSKPSLSSLQTATYSGSATQHQIADNIPKQEQNTTSNEIKTNFISNSGVIKTTSNETYKMFHQGVPTQPKTEDLKPSEIISTNIKDVMFKLQTNPADFFGTFNQAEIPRDNSFSQLSIECKSEISKEEQKRHEVITKSSGDSPKITTPSGPLLGFSNMLADKTIELNDFKDEIKNIVIREPSDGEALFNRTVNVSFFDNAVTEVKNEPSDLNICETCREIEHLDDLEEKEDLTTQMIENITSPICLENAVEVPLPENNTGVEQRDEFDPNQCAEISHITEETFETIQVQSATELLDAPPSREYGWSADEIPVVPANIDEHSFQLPSFKPTDLENEFSLAVDPNSKNFFANNNLFENITTNIGAELKAEFKDQDAAHVIVPRQINAATSPSEEEEEDKSDGIDVHSIEQDASKDFPLFEQYVIEPAKDSDEENEEAYESSGKIESFTRRVDNFKSHEDTEITEEISPVFNLPKSPPKPMASYFDTGNYAVETHYRNSLTSPILIPFEPPNTIRVPPGFEEEFQKRLSLQDKDIFGGGSEPYIPDTTTQTKPTYSSSFSTSQTLASISTYVTTSLLASVQGYIDSTAKLPELSSAFSSKVSPDSAHTTALADLTAKFGHFSQIDKEEPVPHVKKLITDLSEFSLFGPEKDDVALEPTLVEQTPHAPLPDPLNFFDDNTECEQQGFNRLASYFSSPAKTDHNKSFFELSESQNHYRHIPDATLTNCIPEYNPNAPSKANIPPDQYLANVKLMRDLTSFQNPEFKPDQTVRTVNYFTIEYDKAHVLSEFSRGEPYLKTTVDPCDNVDKSDNVEAVPDDNAIIKTLQKCKRCCEAAGSVRKIDAVNPEVMMVFKLRKCMDNNITNTEAKKDIVIMEDDSTSTTNTVITNFGTEPKENNSEGIAVASENRSTAEYIPVRHHWFYRVDVDGKSIWRGFSTVDSKALEEAFCSPALSDTTLVPTDGGRYDVNVNGRLRFAVYWSDKPSNVRRCSWFYKGTTDARYVPYTEDVAETLEDEYRHGITTGEWHRRLVLPNNEMVVMHGPSVMVHFLQASTTDAFSSAPLFSFGKRVYRNPPKIRVARDQPLQIDHLVLLVHGAGEYRHQKEKIQSTMRPRVVRRGHDESEIEDVEPSSIDHLLLLCHGVGSACDMRFRNVEEVVDDFRATSLQLIQSHYKNSFDKGVVGRVEVLPISWHATLHSGETGVDKRLARVTLDSIPKLRNFTNDTVLDVLFYTSPVFCQTIINTVCAELNRIYKLFRVRNPHFKGGVSLGGHSLGSVILYDLLCHQPPKPVAACSTATCSGQPPVNYPPLDFKPDALYALGSPIAIFECIRGVENLGQAFSLPTCKNFFNIFHPYDPIAYRIEPLINPALQEVKPHLIPHHKGRKRMHLELKDTMARVGADIKQKLIESIKTTWTSMWKTQPPEAHLEKVVEEELEKEPLSDESKEREECPAEQTATPDMLGELNGGRRVDYVLQEAPFEMINEYLFAMSSHVCYWESEDTMLMMLREIYNSLGVQPDCTVPQGNLTVQRTKTRQDEISVNVVRKGKDNPSTSKSGVLGE